MNIYNPKNTKTFIVDNLPVNVPSISGKITSNINSFSAKIKNDAILNVIKNDDNISFNVVKLSNQSVKCIFEIEFDDLSKYTKNELVLTEEGEGDHIFSYKKN